MARIRVLKVKGKVNQNKPKVAYFHSDNFDKYTTQKYGKYNITVIGDTQKRKNYGIMYGNDNDNYTLGQFVVQDRVCPKSVTVTTTGTGD